MAQKPYKDVELAIREVLEEYDSEPKQTLVAALKRQLEEVESPDWPTAQVTPVTEDTPGKENGDADPES